MSEIFYSSNIKQVSRFRRKTKLHSLVEGHKPCSDDIPFQSNNEKDSHQYLLDLCRSVYPKELHQALRTFPGWRLSIHSFLVLVVKNFVCSWYGGRIPTPDTEFIILLFELFERFVDELWANRFPTQKMLGNDIPWILNTHIAIMQKVIEENLSLDDFYDLNLYRYQYPQAISKKLLQHITGDSRLEAAFLDSFLNELLLDKLIDKILEPFIILDIIKVICERQLASNDIPLKKNAVLKERDLVSFAKIASHIFTSTVRQIKLFVAAPFSGVKIADLFLFKLIADSMKLSLRKPLLYHFCKTVQLFSNRIALVNSGIALFFNEFFGSFKAENSQILFIKMRHILFPNDNKMGQSRIEPTPDEILVLKSNCSELLYRVCVKNHLDIIIGTTRSDCSDFIDGLTRNRSMNKFILQRILDYLVNGYPLYD